MNSPSRNIPIRTVIVAAIVVEKLAVIDRSASPTNSLALTGLPRRRPRLRGLSRYP